MVKHGIGTFDFFACLFILAVAAAIMCYVVLLFPFRFVVVVFLPCEKVRYITKQIIPPANSREDERGQDRQCADRYFRSCT